MRGRCRDIAEVIAILGKISILLSNVWCKLHQMSFIFSKFTTKEFDRCNSPVSVRKLPLVKLPDKVFEAFFDLYPVNLIFTVLIFRTEVVAEKYAGVVESSVHVFVLFTWYTAAGRFSRELNFRVTLQFGGRRCV